MPDRVVQVLGPSAGGIRRHVGALSAGLERLGWDVRVAAPSGVMAGAGRQDAVVDVPAVSVSGLLRLPAARRLLRTVFEGADVVHAHGLKAAIVCASVRPRPPLIVTVHNLVLDEAAGRLAPVLRALERRVPRWADHTICVSDEMADLLTPGAPAGSVEVIAPVAPLPDARRAAADVRRDRGIADDAPMVLCLYRFHPQKDIPTLLRAVPELARLVPGVVVLIVGEGPEEARLRSLAAELDVGETVRFATTTWPADDLAAADVVAMPARWEGNPVLLVEALHLAKAVVATPVGQIPDLVEDGVTGRLVPVGDEHGFARVLAELLGDPSQRARLGSAGQARLRERYDPEALVSRVEAAYRASMAGR